MFHYVDFKRMVLKIDENVTNKKMKLLPDLKESANRSVLVKKTYNFSVFKLKTRAFMNTHVQLQLTYLIEVISQDCLIISHTPYLPFFNNDKLMNKVKDLQRGHKLAVLLMAHTPKIVQGEAIIANNLADSSNLYNLADSVMAINMTTMSDDIRYIKQVTANHKYIM